MSGVVRDHGARREVEVETLEDGSVRVDMRGDGAKCCCGARAKASTRCSTSSTPRFRRDVDYEQRIVIDSLGFRRGKDIELEQMTQYLIDR